MATGKSGSFTLTSGYFTCQISWEENYSVTANTSTITVTAKIKSSGYYNQDYYPNGSISVNGTKLVTFNSATPTHMVYVVSRNTYYGFTNTSGTSKTTWKSGSITHNSDGTKSVDIAADFYLYTPGGNYGSGTRIKGSKTVALTSIDRAAPTVSVSASNITTTGFKISASTNVNCNIWDYSLDGGRTWENFSTKSGTAASVTVSDLTVNTSYSVKVRARKSSNYVYGTSSTKSVKTLGYAIVDTGSVFYVDVASPTVRFHVTVYEASYSHTVTILDGTTVLFAVDNLKWTAGASSRSIALTTEQQNAMLSRMTTVKSKVFKLMVTTKNGTTVIGTSSISITAKTSSANSGVTFGSFTYKDSYYSAVTGNELVMIQKHSHLVVTAEAATAKNYASISYYTASIADVTIKSSSTTIDVGRIQTSGVLALKVTAVDSRGYTKSITKYVTVLKYNNIKLTKTVARREDGIEPTIQLNFSGSMSAIMADGETNTNRLCGSMYRYRETSVEDFGPWTSLLDDTTVSSTGTSFSYETLQLIELDAKKSYRFQIYVTDRISSDTIAVTIPKGTPLVAFRKEKLGINTPSPQYAMDIVGDARVSGALYNKDGRNVIADTGWISLGLSEDVSEAADNPKLGHYYGCAYRAVGENHVYVAFGCAVTHTGSTVYVNGDSIPSAYRPSMQPYALVPVNGSRMARIFVSRSTGKVGIEWIKNVGDDAEPDTHTVTWIDGYLDYWLD